MTYYKSSDEFGEEIFLSNNRCYNCHHNFKNSPFFLPIDFSEISKRFKITGNFCSPNCVKSYSFINNTKNKHLVSLMYKKLYGYDYNIKTAPPIQILKEYGGNLSIEEYRKSFNTNINYINKKLDCKIIMNEIIIK